MTKYCCFSLLHVRHWIMLLPFLSVKLNGMGLVQGVSSSVVAQRSNSCTPCRFRTTLLTNRPILFSGISNESMMLSLWAINFCLTRLIGKISKELAAGLSIIFQFEFWRLSKLLMHLISASNTETWPQKTGKRISGNKTVELGKNACGASMARD